MNYTEEGASTVDQTIEAPKDGTEMIESIKPAIDHSVNPLDRPHPLQKPTYARSPERSNVRCITTKLRMAADDRVAFEGAIHERAPQHDGIIDAATFTPPDDFLGSNPSIKESSETKEAIKELFRSCRTLDDLADAQRPWEKDDNQGFTYFGAAVFVAGAWASKGHCTKEDARRILVARALKLGARRQQMKKPKSFDKMFDAGLKSNHDELHLPKTNGGAIKNMMAHFYNATAPKFFHDGDTAMVTIDRHGDGPVIRQSYAVKSKAFSLACRTIFRKLSGDSVAADILKQFTDECEAEAIEGPQRTAHLRIGQHDGRHFADKGDGNVIEITATGWKVIPMRDCPIAFRALSTSLPLPDPARVAPEARTATLNELFSLIHVINDHRAVLLAILVNSFIFADQDQPIVSLRAVQRSGKSEAASRIKTLIDPTQVKKRAPAQELANVVSAAKNSRALLFDNQSFLAPALCDAFCCLSTGADFAERRLYENQEEASFSARRLSIFTGITDLATQPDFLDRQISLRLKGIAAGDNAHHLGEPGWCRKIPQFELDRRMAAASPAILGLLLDLAVAALQNRNAINVSKLEDLRLTEWVQSTLGMLISPIAMKALGRDVAGLEPAPAFLAMLRKASVETAQLSVEGDSIWSAIEELSHEGAITVTFGGLLDYLESKIPQSRRGKFFPTSARGLASSLARGEPGLLAVGVVITRHAHTKVGTKVSISRTDGHYKPNPDGCARHWDDDGVMTISGARTF
jgi:hypothetical protein